MKPLITALIAGAPYLLHPQKLGTIQETIFPDALIPVTLLTTEELNGDLNGILRRFDNSDDVFVPAFGEVLVEKPDKNSTSSSSKARSLISRSDGKYHLQSVNSAVSVQETDFDDLPSGPYFLYGPNLYQAWKLYDDSSDAFAYGVIPENATNIDDYRVMTALSQDGASKAIPVPSRLYFKESRQKPLAGLRITVPDTIALKGVANTLSSRDWAQLRSDPEDTTAAYVQKLVDRGAVVVGKTKSSSFTTGQEWVDAAQPWNPRGDGYQKSGSGSPGSAAAMAAYDWLELAVGHDSPSGEILWVEKSHRVSLKGVHNPGARNGVYELRTSANISSDGKQAISKTFDATSFHFRDVDGFSQTTPDILGLKQANATNSIRLVHPRDFNVSPSPEHEKLVERFITAVENTLGIKTQYISLEDTWAKKMPSEAKGQLLRDYMRGPPFEVFCYEFYHQFDSFRADFQDRFNRNPYVEATPAFQWSTGKNVTQDKYEEHIKRIEVFRKWFDEHIFSITDAKGVMILPVDVKEPSYRDEAPRAPVEAEGYTANNLAPLLQAPLLTIPFGQLPYDSRISGRKEYRPITASIMGGKGSDAQLLEIVRQALRNAKISGKVDTGPLAFPS